MDKYARAVQSSYTYSKESPTKAKEYVATNLPGYHIHEGLSDNHSVVLHNDKNDDVIIAYRGTLNDIHHPIQSLQDYVADADIALGLHHFETIPRVEEADAKYHRVASAFPGANIKTTGHSLGAVQSYQVATKNNLEGHHFQMGESPIGGIATFNRTEALFHKGERYDKQHIYHADRYSALGNIYKASDPISEGTKYIAGNHHVLKVNTKTDIGIHGLSNFINPKNPTQKNVATFLTPKNLKETELETFVFRKQKHKKKMSRNSNEPRS